MIDLERYVFDFVDPTIDDFEKNPTSVRHAFLACVAAFHGVDYLAWPDEPGKLRSHLRRDEDSRIVDDVAHAFKHVATSRRPNKGLRQAMWLPVLGVLSTAQRSTDRTLTRRPAESP